MLARPQGESLFLLSLEHEAKACAGVSGMWESDPLGDLQVQHVEVPRVQRGDQGRGMKFAGLAHRYPD